MTYLWLSYIAWNCTCLQWKPAKKQLINYTGLITYLVVSVEQSTILFWQMRGLGANAGGSLAASMPWYFIDKWSSTKSNQMLKCFRLSLWKYLNGFVARLALVCLTLMHSSYPPTVSKIYALGKSLSFMSTTPWSFSSIPQLSTLKTQSGLPSQGKR